jgi:hypothetical protein
MAASSAWAAARAMRGGVRQPRDGLEAADPMIPLRWLSTDAKQQPSRGEEQRKGDRELEMG